jgi:hypothetical protein
MVKPVKVPTLVRDEEVEVEVSKVAEEGIVVPFTEVTPAREVTSPELFPIDTD